MFDFFNSSLGDMFNYSYSYDFKQYDWEDLKTKGTVTEALEEKNGFRTITKTFVSFDGTTKITSSESSPIIDVLKKQLNEIDNKIKKAIEIEDYETAASLKKEKTKLLSQSKQNNA
jgi:protein-arginine kinase activator protein McsA